MLHDLHHLQLAVVVATVEQHLFYGDDLAVLGARAPHDAKGAVADDLLQLVTVAAAVPDGALLDALHEIRDLRAGASGQSGVVIDVSALGWPGHAAHAAVMR